MRADTDYAICMQVVTRYGNRMQPAILDLLSSGDTEMRPMLCTRTHSLFVHDISGTQIRARNAQNGDDRDVEFRMPLVSEQWYTGIRQQETA